MSSFFVIFFGRKIARDGFKGCISRNPAQIYYLSRIPLKCRSIFHRIPFPVRYISTIPLLSVFDISFVGRNKFRKNFTRTLHVRLTLMGKVVCSLPIFCKHVELREPQIRRKIKHRKSTIPKFQAWLHIDILYFIFQIKDYSNKNLIQSSHYLDQVLELLVRLTPNFGSPCISEHTGKDTGRKPFGKFDENLRESGVI